MNTVIGTVNRMIEEEKNIVVKTYTCEYCGLIQSQDKKAILDHEKACKKDIMLKQSLTEHAGKWFHDDTDDSLIIVLKYNAKMGQMSIIKAVRLDVNIVNVYQTTIMAYKFNARLVNKEIQEVTYDKAFVKFNEYLTALGRQ